MPDKNLFDYKVSIKGKTEMFIAFNNPVTIGEFIKVDDILAKVTCIIHSFGESEIIASKVLSEDEIKAKFV